MSFNPTADEIESRAYSALGWATWALGTLRQMSFTSVPTVFYPTVVVTSACMSFRMHQLIGTLGRHSLTELQPERVEHVTVLLRELDSVLSTVVDLADERGMNRSAICRFFVDDAKRGVNRLRTIVTSGPEQLRFIANPGQAEPWRSSRPAYGSAIAAVEHLGQLEPGWNSYDGVVIAREASHRATEFLRFLARTTPRIPAPIIGPTPDGGVALQWRSKDYEVEIVFLAKGEEYSVAERGSDRFILEGSDLSPERLVEEILTKYSLSR